MLELSRGEEDGIDYNRDRREAAPAFESSTVEHYYDNTPKPPRVLRVVKVHRVLKVHKVLTGAQGAALGCRARNAQNLQHR